MAVNTTYAPIEQAGNGATLAFSFAFKILAQTDLVVRKKAADGTYSAPLTLGADYTVVFDSTAETGTVTYTVAPVSSGASRIERVSDKTQATVYPREGPFPAKTTETVVDKLTLLVQELLLVPVELSGVAASRPVAATVKTYYYATDTLKYSVYLPASAVWVALN